MNVHIGVILCVLCCSVCLVCSFPYKRSFQSPDYYNFDPYLVQDILDNYNPTEDVYSFSRGILNKRGATKRYSLSDLLAKLRAMVGSDEIHHSGRSSYLRFGAGGK